MTQIQPQLTRRFLAVAISAMLSGHALALEAISDEAMSEATGEGIALLPEDFKFVMEDSDDSYINLIPRGPTKGPDGIVGTTDDPKRADLYIRNLSITADDESATRASGTPIASWGSGANPFLIAVKSESHPDYTTAGVSRSFLRIETPNYCPAGSAVSGDCPAGADTGAALSAYNLRLGLTLDILSKTSTDTQGYIHPTLGSITGNNLFGNRGVAFQAIWNGLSINGSRIDVFQTPSNDPTANSQANGTLGIRALIRLNTDFDASDTAKSNNGLRLTTGLDTDTDGAGPDTGYNGTTNRLFRDGEGITIEDLVINLPLGAPHYQSLVFGKADTGDGNFYIELTRIPNSLAAYNAAYINYANAADVTAKTCTSTTCGSTAVPATHGTISMGNVTFRDINGNNAVNLGSARIDGLFIQHLKLTTTGL